MCDLKGTQLILIKNHMVQVFLGSVQDTELDIWLRQVFPAGFALIRKGHQALTFQTS